METKTPAHIEAIEDCREILNMVRAAYISEARKELESSARYLSLRASIKRLTQEAIEVVAQASLDELNKIEAYASSTLKSYREKGILPDSYSFLGNEGEFAFNVSVNLNSKWAVRVNRAAELTDVIFELEGFEPTEQKRRVDEAVLAGRVSRAQAIDELVEYAKQHKTTEGFIETRTWA